LDYLPGLPLLSAKVVRRRIGRLSKSSKNKTKAQGALEYLGELYLEIGQLEKAKLQLENLDKACFFPCKQYRELKEEIEKYEAG